MMKYIKRQAGIGLVEVLIAAIVFILAGLALIQLQGGFFQSSSSANAHSIAMGIAQEKMEDLRGFQLPEASDGDIFDFTTIGTNTGGRCTIPFVDDDACPLELPSGTVTVGNITYTRSWTGTNYYYDNTGTLTTTAPAGVTLPDQKHVILTVTWTDTDNSAQTLTLNSVINKNSGASVGIITNFAGGSGEKPTIPYTASTDDRVVPVSVGTDVDRETLVPSSTTIDGYSHTKFTSYVYDTAGTELIRQEDFKTVACDCRFNGSGDAYAAASAEWSTVEDTYLDINGEIVSKVKGCVANTSGNACEANPDPFCETCCQDHHDKAGIDPKYDPFRSTSDGYVSGNHKHFLGTTAVTTGPYTESCRFKRVDGYWRVYQDWHMVGYTAFPLSDLQTYATEYETYVLNVINAHLDQSKVAGETLSSPPTLDSNLIHKSNSTAVNLGSGSKENLTARAIYLDNLDSTHLATVSTKKGAGLDYLIHVPFYEIEVADISSWGSADSTTVNVGPYDGPGNSNDLDGGEVHALAASTTAVDITGMIKKSNSGISALTLAVDYGLTTNSDETINTDYVKVCAGGSCSGTPPVTSCTLPWGGSILDTTSVTAYLAPSVISPSVCSTQTRVCSSGTLSGSYQYETCSVGTTCTTSISGKAENNSFTVAVTGDASATCTVASNKNYTCNAVTTAITASLSVIQTDLSSGTTTNILGTICGAQVSDF